MSPRTPRHEIAVIVEGQTIGGWESYEIETNMIEPADAFSLRRPFDAASWIAIPRGARIRVTIDGVVILDGFVDSRRKSSRDGLLEIAGRDRAGRLVQDAAPAISYAGLELVEAIRRLASPWFRRVTLSDARNRGARMGRSRRRRPAGREPLVVRRTADDAGRVELGAFRWAVIQALASRFGLIAWSSADGEELFVGYPNHEQAASYTIRKARREVSGASSNCLDLVWDEDDGDRYSEIEVVGSGGGGEVDYGAAVASRRAIVRDGDGPNGTGRDFRYPKRLVLPERHLGTGRDAELEAELERARRDFRRTIIRAEMPYHGAWHGAGATLYAPNTVADVVDEDFSPVRRARGLIYSCRYRRSRDEGEVTSIEMVPAGTEIVL